MKIKRLLNPKTILMVVVIVTLLLLPHFIKKAYYMHILILTGYYIILALSVNMVTGFTGNLFLGAAGFAGIGAYTSTLVSLRLGAPFLIAIIVAGLVSMLAGFLLGYPCLRLVGPYFAIATFGFGEVVRLILINWYSVTNGPLGIRGVPAPAFGIGPLTYTITSRVGFYYLLLALISVSVFVIYRIVHSYIGRAFWAIRADTYVQAQMIGINATKVKIMSFMVTAFFAGLGGSFYAHYIGYVSPDAFVFQESASAVSMAVVGGMGTIIGPVIGGMILALGVEFLRIASAYRMVLFGLVMFGSILLMPDGIVGLYNRGSAKLLKTLQAKQAARGVSK